MEVCVPINHIMVSRDILFPSLEQISQNGLLLPLSDLLLWENSLTLLRVNMVECTFLGKSIGLIFLPFILVSLIDLLDSAEALGEPVSLIEKL